MSERLTKWSFDNAFGVKKLDGHLAGTQECMNRLYEIEQILYDVDGNEVISLARLRELVDAERDGRVVVLPVAVGELAYTPEGDATVKNWDITARVTFCVPHRSGMYWSDKYSDFDILDVLNPEAERALAAADAEGKLIILGKAFKERDGRFMTLVRRADGMMMSRTDDTAEASEANAAALAKGE